MTDLSPLPKFRATVAGTGIPLVGGQLFTYAAGTVPNPGNYQATYKDSIGTSNTNPVILNSYGECDLWLGNLSYKFVLQDSLGNTLWTVDDVKSIGVTGIEAIVEAAISELFIENFAAISSTPVVAGKVYYLKEYNSGTGLGGGNLLAYTSTDTPDNGIIFASGTAGIRLKRIGYSIPDATMYGIRLDGTLSNTALQSAVTALAGKSLYFPDGEYNFSVFPSGIDAVRMEGSSRIVWTDKKMPIFNGVFTGGLETALVSGCIRYYDADGGDAAGWYFLVDKGEDHDPILTGPITASGNFAQFLSVNFSDFGLDPTLWTPSGVVVGADDTLAKEGITVGASVGDTQIEIYGSFNACSNTVVRYNNTPGSGWTYEGASGGLATYTFSWVDNSLATAYLRITRTAGARAFRPASYLGSDFRLTPKVKTTGDVVNIPPYIPYIASQGVDGSGDTYVDVVFYDPVANTRLTTLNEYVVFLMEDYGAVNTQLRWQDIDNAHGNIWFVGTFVRKPSSL